MLHKVWKANEFQVNVASLANLVNMTGGDLMKTLAGDDITSMAGFQFRPPIALRTDLSHITTELLEIPLLRMAH